MNESQTGWVVEVVGYVYACDAAGTLWLEDPSGAESLTDEAAQRRSLTFWSAEVRPLCEAVRDYNHRLRIGFPAVGLFSTPLGRSLSLHEIGLHPGFWKSPHA